MFSQAEDVNHRHNVDTSWSFALFRGYSAHRGVVGGGVTTSHRLLFFFFQGPLWEREREKEIEMQSLCTLVTHARRHHPRLHSQAQQRAVRGLQSARAVLSYIS